MSDIDELEAEFEEMEKKAVVEACRQTTQVDELALIVREELESRVDHHKQQSWAWGYITIALVAGAAVMLPVGWLGLAWGLSTGFGAHRTGLSFYKYLKAKRSLKKYLTQQEAHADAQDW
jgi:hypothetical protein